MEAPYSHILQALATWSLIASKEKKRINERNHCFFLVGCSRSPSFFVCILTYSLFIRVYRCNRIPQWRARGQQYLPSTFLFFFSFFISIQHWLRRSSEPPHHSISLSLLWAPLYLSFSSLRYVSHFFFCLFVYFFIYTFFFCCCLICFCRFLFSNLRQKATQKEWKNVQRVICCYYHSLPVHLSRLLLSFLFIFTFLLFTICVTLRCLPWFSHITMNSVSQTTK